MLAETSVRGATVYTVSDRASDAEAARVAATENAADKAGGMAESRSATSTTSCSTSPGAETRWPGHQFATSLIDFWKAGDLNKEPSPLGRIRGPQGAGRAVRAIELGYTCPMIATSRS
ncbi:MAG: hypothetical protein U1E30_04565 [Rhodoblastus sp.]